MTIRKPNYAEQIAELKNEIDTVEKFMAPAVREAIELDEISKERKLTVKEYRRVQELIDYIHEKNIFLVKAKETVKAFYTPVSA